MRFSIRKGLRSNRMKIFCSDFSNPMYMIADKKTSGNKSPYQTNEELRSKHQDEFDMKRKVIREKMRTRRVTYIVKDLPIY